MQPWQRTLTGLMLLFLAVSVTGCAVMQPAETVQCLHPEIDLSTNAGMAQAIQRYQSALDLCNLLNGV